jgi:hypothetical protein
MTKNRRPVFIKVDADFRKMLKVESGIKEKSMIEITKDFASNKSLWNISYEDSKIQENINNEKRKQQIRFKPF